MVGVGQAELTWALGEHAHMFDVRCSTFGSSELTEATTGYVCLCTYAPPLSTRGKHNNGNLTSTVLHPPRFLHRGKDLCSRSPAGVPLAWRYLQAHSVPSVHLAMQVVAVAIKPKESSFLSQAPVFSRHELVKKFLPSVDRIHSC